MDRPVWSEAHDTRERQSKEWQRAWKLELIENENPEWNDLYETINH